STCISITRYLVCSSSLFFLYFFFFLLPPPPRSTLFPYTTLFRSASDRRPIAFYSWLPPLGPLPAARARISSAALRPDLGVLPETAGSTVARERYALSTGRTGCRGISVPPSSTRSEERRVGKECRSQGPPHQQKE